MMSEGELLKIIQRTVRAELAPIMMAVQTDSDSVARASVARFATDAVQAGLRNIQPYGFASRAPDGTECLTIPVAHDPSNKMVVGHFDGARPALEKGETAHYGPAGQSIVMKADGRIYQGRGGDAMEPVVLGNILKEFLTNVIDAFLNASMIGIDSLGGAVQLAPDLRMQLSQYKTTYLETDSTDILSSINFVERS